METAVIALMALVMLNFVLKISFFHITEAMVLSVIVLLTVALSWPLAIEQSKTQITDWLNNQQQMLDTAILLTIDISLQLGFCFSMAGKLAKEEWRTKLKLKHLLLSYFPGLTVLIVLFSLLVWTIFTFPGCDFQIVSWGVGCVVAVAIPVLSYAAKFFLPEKEIRLELLFMGNILAGILCIVTTVNGKTAVEGNTTIDWTSLLLVCAITLMGALVGLALLQYKQNKQN